MKSNLATLANHFNTVGHISVREAMSEYNMSGGSLTKTISIMRRNGTAINTDWRRNPVSGRRYARYFIDWRHLPLNVTE